MPVVLAIGLDPAFVEIPGHPELTPELVRAYIEMQLEQLRAAGYVVQGCLVDLGETAEAVATQYLNAQDFDCVMIGAGLRDANRLLLFEKLLNVIHAHAPRAKICLNTMPADTVEAVQRWV